MVCPVCVLTAAAPYIAIGVTGGVLAARRVAMTQPAPVGRVGTYSAGRVTFSGK